MINLSFSGILYQYFPGFWPYMKPRLVIVSIGLMLVFLTLFSRCFFEDSKKKLPRGIHRLTQVFVFFPLMLTVINLVEYSTFSIALTGLMGVIVPLGLLMSALWMILARRGGSYLYVLATGSVLTGFMLYCLKDFSLLPNNHATSYTLFYSSCFEMLLLAVAIANKFGGLRLRNEELLKAVVAKEKDLELTRLTRQLAHDIRSPLAALEMILPATSALAEDNRLIIRNSINRIRDIANSLLHKDQERVRPVVNPAAPLSSNQQVHYLAPLIESMVTEKRLQYRDQLGISIEFNQAQAPYGLFVKVDSNELKRVLSNLINNSVEAFIASEGLVVIDLLEASNQRVEIRLSDNGKGIPPGLLPKLGIKGVTQGKPSGNGLGLVHARECVERWGGSFRIESSDQPG